VAGERAARAHERGGGSFITVPALSRDRRTEVHADPATTAKRRRPASRRAARSADTLCTVMKCSAETTRGPGAAAEPAFAPPPRVGLVRWHTLPSDAQRATFERTGGGRGLNPLRLCNPSTTLGIAALVERRAPKRVVALLDTEGRRIRWGANGWELAPWRFDP
jgi:hypothetical protein